MLCKHLADYLPRSRPLPNRISSLNEIPANQEEYRENYDDQETDGLHVSIHPYKGTENLSSDVSSVILLSQKLQKAPLLDRHDCKENSSSTQEGSHPYCIYTPSERVEWGVS